MEVTHQRKLYQAPRAETLEFHPPKDLLLVFSLEGDIQLPRDGGNW